MAEEKPAGQPQWDFPPRGEPRSEVIPIPDRQPTYPRDTQRDEPRRVR